MDNSQDDHMAADYGSLQTAGDVVDDDRPLEEPPRWLWQGKLGPAFWTVASLISLSINIFLIAILVLLGREIFSLKALVDQQLINGLYKNFIRMDEAHIVTTIRVQDTIQVSDQMPVVFDLPLRQDTQVVLTQNTPVKNATIYLNGAAVPLDLVLKEGTQLNIRLDMTVPVSQTIPVELTVPVDLIVPVDIPLNQTELHEPFIGLRNVVAPYNQLLTPLPDSWQETALCGSWTGWLCGWIFEE